MCAGLKSASLKAPDGSPSDTPKQVGVGSLVHPQKPSGFLGLAPKAESVGRFLESVSFRRGIASRIYAEQKLNEGAVSRVFRACFNELTGLRLLAARCLLGNPDAGIAVELGEAAVVPRAQG